MRTPVENRLRIGAILLLAASAAALFCNQNTIFKLRAEQKTLPSENQEVTTSRAEAKTNFVSDVENDEIKKLRGENRDLPKLRNDVRQARRQAEEAAKMQAANQELTTQLKQIESQGAKAALPAGFIRASSLTESGLLSPEAAMQTIFAAMLKGDRQRLMQAMDTDAASRLEKETDDQFRAESTQMKSGLAGYTIVDKQFKSADEVTLSIQLNDVNNIPSPFHLVRVGSDWKLSMPR